MKEECFEKKNKENNIKIEISDLCFCFLDRV